MPCTTHHHACDCREAEFARIKLERDRFREALRFFADMAELAERAHAENAPIMLELKEAVDEFRRARAALGEGE